MRPSTDDTSYTEDVAANGPMCTKDAFNDSKTVFAVPTEVSVNTQKQFWELGFSPAWLLTDFSFLTAQSLHLAVRTVCTMPLRSRGRYSEAKRGELDKIYALLLLLRPLLQSGSLHSGLEAAVGSADEVPASPGRRVQRQRTDVAEECWKRERHSKTARVDADQPAPRDKLQQDGWSVEEEHTLAGFHRPKEEVFLASVKKEAKV